MIISFFGHADFVRTEHYEKKLLALLKKIANNNKTHFYLGGYGKFDGFALSCCKKYKSDNPNSDIVFITPYLANFLDNRKDYLKSYDEIIYPPLENVPKRFAIISRNKWMVDNSDVIIVFISRNFGGANIAYEYAKKQKKEVINLYDY